MESKGITYEEFLSKQGLPNGFPKEVLLECDSIPDYVIDEDKEERLDLTDELIITIDGDTAKDFDDAISITPLMNGNITLGVHIADVSHYVKVGSKLDAEAYERGNSTYLINKVVPMLPHKLSNGICSLNEGVERLCLSVLMEVDAQGGMISYDIKRTVIKSRHRMTYNDVQKIIDGDPQLSHKYANIVPMLDTMSKLAKILLAKRIRRGSLEFEIPEPEIILDEDEKPISVGKYPIYFSNHIIEEFMLLANETIARHFEKLKVPLVFRIHENPEPEKIARFAKMLSSVGIRLKIDKNETVNPKALQEIIKLIHNEPYELACETLMLRSMMKARYWGENLGHFGLAAKYYCHYTSPIRRYPDLIVHRIIKAYMDSEIDEEDLPQLRDYCNQAGNHLSECENVSTKAERDWDAYKMAEYMEDKVGDLFEGTITSVTSFGLFIMLDNLIEGLVKIGDLKDDYYIFDEINATLTGKRSGNLYSIGDKLTVQLVRVNKDLMQIDFIIKEDTQYNKKKRETKKVIGETYKHRKLKIRKRK